jgi:hypothetical protein
VVRIAAGYRLGGLGYEARFQMGTTRSLSRG